MASILATSAIVGCNRTSTAPTPTDTGFPTDFEACAEERFEASFVPVNMLLTIDRSDSMGDGTPTSKWEAATEAVTSFLASPDADRLRVALRMWPEDDGCNTLVCDPEACSAPQVPLGPLSDKAHRTAIVDALAAGKPSGETPLSAAMDGAARWATGQLAATPAEQVVIALVTDGRANGCDEDIGNISAFAGQAAAAGAPTFVVGIEGSMEAEVDAIAAAGGTGNAYFVGTKDVESQLLEALLDVQGQVLDCVFDLPPGDALNSDLVRVETQVGDEITVIPRVGAEDRCIDGEGWYLDVNQRITLCSGSCTTVQETVGVSLAIAVGCECEQDTDCTDGEVCEDNECVHCEGPECPGSGDTGSLLAGRNVQGGAQNCGTVPGQGGWLLALVGVILLRRRS